MTRRTILRGTSELVLHEPREDSFDEIRMAFEAILESAEGAVGLHSGRLRRSLSLDSLPQLPDQIPSILCVPGLSARPLWTLREFSTEIQHVVDRVLDAVDEVADAAAHGPIDAFQVGRTGYFGLTDWWRQWHLIAKAGITDRRLPELFPSIYEAMMDAYDANELCAAFIAQLSPGSHLERHAGAFNHSLRLHIGLTGSDPEGMSGLRVGSVEFPSSPGLLVAFDDTFTHEAWNWSSEPKMSLVIQAWHPELTGEERILVRELEARPDFWRLCSLVRATQGLVA